MRQRWRRPGATAVVLLTFLLSAATPAHGASDAAAGAQRALLDFQDPRAAKLLVPDDEGGIRTSVVNGAMRLAVPKGREYAVVSFDRSLLKGWERFDFLSLEFRSDDATLTPLTVELWDGASKNYATRCTFEGAKVLHAGRTRVLVDLRRARRNRVESLSPGDWKPADLIDRAALTRVKFWFATKGHAADYVCQLDNVRLLKESALGSGMKVALPAGARGFDFGGAATPVVAGFTAVGPADAYSKEKGFGFVAPKGLVAEGRDFPDPLTGDYVVGASLEFRADVPDGKYLAWVAGGFYPAPNLRVALSVNDAPLFARTMDWATFYSKEGLFRFVDLEYSEKPNALWRTAVSRAFPGTVVEVTVAGGAVVVKGQNAFVGALILMPAAGRAAFDAMAKEIEAERIRAFHEERYLQRPANEPCAVADAKVLLFAPAAGKAVMPWSGMSAKDAQKVEVVATPGETIAFQVAVRPFADVGQATLVVGDLAGPGGASIPASAATVHRKKYLSDGETVRPWCLVAANTAELENGLTTAFWLRLRIPPQAKAGDYVTRVTLSAGGESRALPVTVHVYPFTLAADAPVGWGFYYQPPDEGQFVSYNAFKANAADRDRLLAEQMELMRDFGLTTVQAPCPPVRQAGRGSATIDTGPTEKVVRAARAAGMGTRAEQAFLVYTLGMGRGIGNRLRPGYAPGQELAAPGFGPAYVAAVRQLVDWANTTKTPLIHWVVDEPRETPNPWNRNLADTIAYCKLARQAPGATLLVTPMGDANTGVDYLPLLDHLDIVSTHPTHHSARMIERAMRDPKLGLHIYNAGKDRFSTGFYVWRVGATGKWEWHFNQWVHEARKDGYAGRDVHNPFLPYEHTAAAVPAPLSHKGGVLPKEEMFTTAQGIDDYRYVLTLEREIARAKAGGQRATAVAEAEAYLAALRNGIPVTPDVANLAGAADLALVGEGIKGDAADGVEAYRRKVADLIVKVQGR